MVELMELHKKRMSVHGTTTKEDLMDTIFDSFEENIAYTLVDFNGRKRGIHFISRRDKNYMFEATVVSRPKEPFIVGDYIKLPNGMFWLCTDIDDSTITKYTFKQCNNTIKWHIRSEIIYELPCIVTDKTSVYSDGIWETKWTFIPDDQIMIIIPHNDITETIKLGYRLIFNHDKDIVYKLQRRDKLSQAYSGQGLSVLKLKKDNYNELTDSLELNLVNYYPYLPLPDIPDDTPIPNYSVSLVGSDKIKGNAKSNYIATVKFGGVEVFDQAVDFTLTTSVNGVASIYSVDGSTCIVIGNTKNILGTATLKASLASNPAVVVEKEIQIASLF